MKKNYSWLFGVALFLVGLGVGYFLYGSSSFEDQSTKVNTRLGGYNFISPLLECENESYIAHSEYIPFEKNITYNIKQLMLSKYPGLEVSVYFRNLQNGPWFGINEEALFSPASLLKLPILITYLKIAENNPGFLDQEIETSRSSDVSQNFKPENPLEIGKKYTVRQLLESLIIESDNTASENLIYNLPEKDFEKVFNDLGVPLPDEKNPDADFITVKEYAGFFRILYNATYLSKDLSEYALSLLTRTKFQDRLIKSLEGKNIILAHKFGERKFIGPGIDVNQLHDCGIIYYPGYPYLLCIMSKGNTVDFPVLEHVIQDISKMVVDEVKKATK